MYILHIKAKWLHLAYNETTSFLFPRLKKTAKNRESRTSKTALVYTNEVWGQLHEPPPHSDYDDNAEKNAKPNQRDAKSGKKKKEVCPVEIGQLIVWVFTGAKFARFAPLSFAFR